ncbi:guanylate kinase [Candidatus Velamenicoccus archaeovorus]|uniref:guanylate kinase n=1 Tax=Velamenicoccus archaeovorus TaxID=1930593 RepID=UPI000FFE90BE|nr:guanylate kinase [Candidatus Velamenicoccus archaeovorus]
MSNKALQGPRVWIVSGPSGSGKTTLCAALLRDPFWKRRLLRSVSATTRPLRPQEKQGRDYTRISEAAFLGLLKKKAFLEYEKIFGAYYGTPRAVLTRAGRRHKDVLLCIDVKGAQTVRRNLGRARVTSIFVVPPDIQALKRRLCRRSTEGKKDIEKRLKRVKIELSHMGQYDYVVVNDVFDEALDQLKAILAAKSCEVAVAANKPQHV